MNKNQKLLIFPYVLIFYEIAIYLANDMYLPSMPTIAKELFLSQEQVQYTLTFWYLGASSLQLILGPVSDTYGRKKLMLIGALSYVISSIVCAITSDLYLFNVARFVQGTTICSALVVGYAAIHEWYDTKSAIKILALISAVTILAPAFGPLFGAMLTQFASWRYIFWLLAFFALISLFGLGLYMPEHKSENNSKQFNWRHFCLDYYKIFVNRKYMALVISYAFLIAIYFIWMFESPFIMIDIYGKSIMYYGFSQTFIFGGFFVGALFTKLLLGRYPVHILFTFSTVLTVLGAICFLISEFICDSLSCSIVCMFILSVGSSMLLGPISRMAIESSSQPMGKRTAVSSMIVSLFGAATGWLLAIIDTDSMLNIAILIAACSFAAILLLFCTDVFTTKK